MAGDLSSEVVNYLPQLGFSAIFLLMYFLERKEHREDNKTYQAAINALQEGRIADANKAVELAVKPLEGIHMNLEKIDQKIRISKGETV